MDLTRAPAEAVRAQPDAVLVGAPGTKTVGRSLPPFERRMDQRGRGGGGGNPPPLKALALGVGSVHTPRPARRDPSGLLRPAQSESITDGRPPTRIRRGPCLDRPRASVCALMMCGWSKAMPCCDLDLGGPNKKRPAHKTVAAAAAAAATAAPSPALAGRCCWPHPIQLRGEQTSQTSMYSLPSWGKAP